MPVELRRDRFASRGDAMIAAAARTKEVISFGPFSLIASERRLTKDGAPIELSARAFDILVVLLSHPNEVVSKKDLLAQVWPDVIVEEGSLRFHMTYLRKALGDGKAGARYIATLPGRGYCFVAPVSRPDIQRDNTPAVAGNFPHANLPSRQSRVVGRDEDVLKLSAQLNASRFVTIVGAGGVGKTTVAIAVGHQLVDAFSGALLFVDLGALSDPNLVTAGMASMLGLSVQSTDATPSLIAYLRNKRILLIFDTCEHLVEAIAPLMASIIDAAPQVHILATSREALRVEGEHIYRLDALACPPDDPRLTAAAVRAFPATQLFMERALASGARLDLSEAEAPIVASICRKLDGVALAIELVARRVESYGLQQTAALLDQRLTLLWVGSRTAPPRQKTLQATLDWSFGLLTELERIVLRRLAVFVGHFPLDAALEVVAGATLDRSTVLGAVDSLVAKSIVATSPLGAMMRYRLLDTTRDYAREIGIDAADATDLSIRHATYFRRWLEQSGKEWSTSSSGIERASHFAAINNVRAALEWCFSPEGNDEVGVNLAAAAVQVFLAMSLLPECHRWSQHALLALDKTGAGGLTEMYLQAALGFSSSQIYGESNAVTEALSRSLAIAAQHGDTAYQVGLLNMEHISHARRGDLRTSLEYARRCGAIAETSDDLTVKALAHAMLGRALQVTGDLAGSRVELDSLMRILSQSHRGPVLLSYDPHYHSYIALARTLWLQGYPTQALELARQGVEASEAMGHPAALALVLAGAASVFLWAGDLDNAQYHTDLSLSHAEANALGPLVAIGQGRKAELAILRGKTKAGVKDLQATLDRLHAVRHEVLTTEFNIALAQGLAALGRSDEGKVLIDESIRQVEVSGEMFYLPELLRVKGGLLLSMPEPEVREAETCFNESLELSRSQGARAWELRTVSDIARHLADQGQSENGRTLLRSVYEKFKEGFETADLKAAEALLSTLK
jgi:predicted ATPase/DNA-binding winged helix-turn-helix (wHTH) protein